MPTLVTQLASYADSSHDQTAHDLTLFVGHRMGSLGVQALGEHQQSVNQAMQGIAESLAAVSSAAGEMTP